MATRIQSPVSRIPKLDRAAAGVYFKCELFTFRNMSETLLRQHGLKVTKQRLALLSALRRSRKPQPVEHLQAAVVHISLTALYRMLDDFLRVGLAQRVDLGHGHTHYEFNDARRHHHHLVCQDCGDVQDIAAPEGDRAIQRVAQRHRFSVRSHSFELFGLCRSCQLTTSS